MRHIQIYRSIDAVARLGSIRRAAETIAISPSALNRQILSLEAEIGAPLFERLPRGVRLSTSGEIYLRSFRAHLADLDRAASRVSDLAGMRSGTVKIGVGEELASTFLPHLVARHRIAHPHVDVQAKVIAFEQVSSALDDYQVDLVIAANPEIDDTVDTIFAEDVAVVVIASADSTLQRSLRLSDLVDRPLIAPTPASGLRNAIDAAFTARRTPRRYAFVTDRIARSTLTADQEALQFALELDVDHDALNRDGLRVLGTAPGVIIRPVVRMLRVKGRTLPIAAAKFAEDTASYIVTRRANEDNAAGDQ